MKKKIIAIVSTLIISSLFTGCVQSKTEVSDKIQVKVSIEPLREFAEIIGGDKVEVSTMVPNGAEPHDFEPKTKDLVELNKSQVFVYNGLGMEDWIDKVLETIENNNLIVVDSSEGCDYIEYSDSVDDEHNHEEEDTHDHEHEEVEDGHNHGKIDPHIWLSLKESKTQCLNIKNALIKVDEENKDYYEANYNNFVQQVDSLYNEYELKFKTLTNKSFVTGHAAFGYICRDFGLKQESVENLFGEGEITPKRLKELTEFCKNNNIKVIFMPDAASAKVSETLAKEVGAKVEKIYSLESMEDNLTYIEAMKDNLEKIYTNLSKE